MINKIKAEIEEYSEVNLNISSLDKKIENVGQILALEKCLKWAEELEKNLIEQIRNKSFWCYQGGVKDHLCVDEAGTRHNIRWGIIEKEFHKESKDE